MTGRTPAFRVTVDGADLTSKWDQRLVSLSITSEAGKKSDELQVEFDARPDPVLGGIPVPTKGSEIEVWIGYEPAPVYMGRYKVDDWKKSGPQRKLSISAKSAELTTKIKAHKSRSFHEKTVGDIVQEVAAGNGLRAIIDGNLSGIEIDHIDQQKESDIHFLSRLAHRVGGVFKLADGKVLFAEQGSSMLPSGIGKLVLTLTEDMTDHWECSRAARGGYGKAIAHYMDHNQGKRVAIAKGKGQIAHRDRVLYHDKHQAEAAAAAKLKSGALGGKVFEADIVGDPAFFAEAMVQVTGFDPDVDGEYLLKTVRHNLTTAGYMTALMGETKTGATAANANGSGGGDDVNSSWDESEE